MNWPPGKDHGRSRLKTKHHGVLSEVLDTSSINDIQINEQNTNTNRVMSLLDDTQLLFTFLINLLQYLEVWHAFRTRAFSGILSVQIHILITLIMPIKTINIM